MDNWKPYICKLFINGKNSVGKKQKKQKSATVFFSVITLFALLWSVNRCDIFNVRTSRSVLFLSFRLSVRPISPKCAPVHNACLPSMVERVCTIATSWFSICVTCSCSSGWSTLPLHWASAPWQGPLHPTTGPWRSQMTFLPVRSTPLSAELYGS